METTFYSVLNNDRNNPSGIIPSSVIDAPLSFFSPDRDETGRDNVNAVPLAQQAQAASSGGAPSIFVAPVNADPIDGLLEGRRWASSLVTYSFTSIFEQDYADYAANSGLYERHLDGFAAAPDSLQDVVRRWLGEISGVSGLSFVELDGSEENTATRLATMRIALSNAPQVAYAYTPWTAEYGGDVWINNETYGAWFAQAEIGEYAYHTLGHELGHALGLKHGHEGGGVNGSALPSSLDSMEYSLMTYRSYENQVVDGAYKNAAGHYAQSLMMLDIQALQYLYGANFETLSGDTHYTFSPTTGELFIDGVGQGQPVTNTIFRTLWDGGGEDTQDFSDYSTALKIDLNPGEYSDLDRFGNSQRALLGETESVYARGHVFNALQFDADPRSLIENAIGGTGNDIIKGNLAANRLEGGDGNDWLNGAAGSDRLLDGMGIDVLTGGDGPDVFVLSEDGARDRVTDFNLEEGDQLDLSAWGVTELSQLLLVTLPQGLEITFNNETLILDNVAPSIFDSSTSSSRISSILLEEPDSPEPSSPLESSPEPSVSPLLLPVEPLIEIAPQVVTPSPLSPGPNTPLTEPSPNVVVSTDGTSSSPSLIPVVPPPARGSISGQVRQDNDGDGDLKDNDSGLGGVTLHLFKAQVIGGQWTRGPLVSSTRTNSAGLYMFSNLPVGTYIVAEVNPSQHTSTMDADGDDPDTILVPVSANTTRIHQDFLDVPTPLEANHKWVGTQDADQFQGRDRAEEAYGRGGDDLLLGDGSDDQLFGNGGNDTLKGGSGNDIVRGAEGDDTLLGGADHDILHGTNARLKGIRETDYLAGGAGEDTFVLGSASHVYYAADGKQDHAWISDFTHGKDNLVLYGSGDLYRTVSQSDGSLALLFKSPNRGAELVAYFADTTTLDLEGSSIQYL